MVNFPNSNIYEDLSIYSPWQYTLSNVFEYITINARANSKVLDLMCGTGYLLNKIKAKRPDLKLLGIDSNNEFISYAQKNYSDISFYSKDVFEIDKANCYDYIICTGGTHHLEDSVKLDFIELISSLLYSGGVAIIADPYIADFDNEIERKFSAAQLGYEYLIYTIENKGSDKVLHECIEIMENDIFRKEFKTSINKFKSLLEQVFNNYEFIKSWPANHSEFGDYYCICKK